MTTVRSTRICSHCRIPCAVPHGNLRECLAALEKEAYSLRLHLQNQPQLEVPGASIARRDGTGANSVR